jgi:hypothetical protein
MTTGVGGRRLGSGAQEGTMNDELLRRIAHLEQAHRRLRRGATVALLAALCALLVGAAPGKPKPVRAAAFHVVDASGRVRAKLAVEHGKPGLIFLDENGAILSAYCGKGTARFSNGRLSFSINNPDCIPVEKE